MARTTNTPKKLYTVGRRHHDYRLTPDGEREWARGRLPFTRRHWLTWRGVHNPRKLGRERILADKKPLWWIIGLGGLLIATPFLPNGMINVAAIFCMFFSATLRSTLVNISMIWPELLTLSVLAPKTLTTNGRVNDFM